VAALVSAVPLRAQVSLSADATAATVRYDGFLRSGVLLFTPIARIDRPQFSLTGRGTFSLFESGNHSTDLIVAGSFFTPRVDRWQGELTADGGISRYLQSNTGYGSVGVRLHGAGTRTGFWTGVSRVSVTGGADLIGSTRGEIGAWTRSGGFALSGGLSGTNVRDVSYVDGGIHARWERDWLQLTGSAGTRAGNQHGGAHHWGDLSATLWMTRRLAVVLGHGVYPVDLAQLAPGGRYSAISMRIATRPPALRDALARTVRYPPPSLVRPVVASFDVKRNRDGTVRLRVRAPGAGHVEIAGDFTDWDALALERTIGDSWQIVLPLASGTHRFNIRVNGAEWGVPPGVGTVQDEFGGVVGLLLIA
jgi:hypothetical protein